MGVITPLSKKIFEQRKALRDRYIRLAVYRCISSRRKGFARRITRPYLWLTERKRSRLTALALRMMAVEAANARRLGFTANAAVLNLGLFFLIAERDIQTLKIDALTNPDPWNRGLATRTILLTIHELDIDKAAGSKLSRALDEGAVPDDLRREVTEAMRAIRKAQSSAKYQFKYLRDGTIAHRDQDAIKQYQDIIEIDEMKVLKIATEFYAGTSKFINMLPKLLLHLSSLDGMIGQIKSRAHGKKR